MVDVIKSLDIKYVPSNAASSFRAIHESLINYGKNTMPPWGDVLNADDIAALWAYVVAGEAKR